MSCGADDGGGGRQERDGEEDGIIRTDCSEILEDDLGGSDI